LTAADVEQAAFCLTENRVVVTHDTDFLALHAAGVLHVGIAFCHKDTLGLGEIIRRLVLVWENYAPEEMVNRVEFL
jgi:hypothetical protein